MFITRIKHPQSSLASHVGAEAPQKVGSVALNATTTRQSLVKGERLVRDVVTAAIQNTAELNGERAEHKNIHSPLQRARSLHV